MCRQADSYKAAADIAREVMEDGRALKLLDAYAALSSSLGQASVGNGPRAAKVILQASLLPSSEYGAHTAMSHIRQSRLRCSSASGWILCEDIIHNTQCKVDLKRFTATLSSNHVEHNESLRF